MDSDGGLVLAKVVSTPHTRFSAGMLAMYKMRLSFEGNDQAMHACFANNTFFLFVQCSLLTSYRNAEILDAVLGLLPLKCGRPASKPFSDPYSSGTLTSRTGASSSSSSNEINLPSGVVLASGVPRNPLVVPSSSRNRMF